MAPSSTNTCVFSLDNEQSFMKGITAGGKYILQHSQKLDWEPLISILAQNDSSQLMLTVLRLNTSTCNIAGRKKRRCFHINPLIFIAEHNHTVLGSLSCGCGYSEVSLCLQISISYFRKYDFCILEQSKGGVFCMFLSLKELLVISMYPRIMNKQLTKKKVAC